VSPRHGRDEDTIEGLRAQLDQVTAELVAALAQLDRMGAGFSVAADGTGPHRPVQPSPRRPASHARTPREQRWLKVVRDTAQGVIPVGAIAMFRPVAHAVKASWAAHPVATAGAGAVALTAATAIVVPASPASPFGASTSQVPAPAASIYSATPIPVVSPSMLPVAAFMSRPRTSSVSGLPFAPVPPSVPSSSAPQGPAPSQQDPGWQPAPVAGTLSVDTTTVDLSAAQTVTVTIRADGGPVRWSAWCGSRDVSIGDAAGAEHGTVTPGNPVDLTVTLGPVQDGRLTATCHIWPGGNLVAVTLPPPPPPPADPSPTDTPTDIPSPLPT